METKQNTMSTPKQVIETAQKAGAKMVDIKFVDTFGTWQHFTIPIAELAEDSFSDGLGFDGSSIRGWKSIEASDMLAMPDPASAFIDPFMAEPTLSLTCTIAETGTKEAYTRDPRGIAPLDTQQDISTEMCLVMEKLGITIERQHHEVATAGQAEIDFRFDTLVKTADHMMLYKYVLKNVARKHGKTVTLMPKPLFGDNGSGMHTHQSLWKKGKPLFAGNEYAGLSKMALHYIGGLLKHAKALCALCSPTTNSYKRLVPGYEAPVNLAYSARNRSAAIRIPTFSDSPKAKRIEYRPPDPSANPYLCYAALLLAGLDGVLNKIDPGEPLDKNIYELPPEELKKVPNMPGSLSEALDHLERDHDFLLKGDVFTSDFLDMWISTKRKEHDALRLRPHPYEFFLYYDV